MVLSIHFTSKSFWNKDRVEFYLPTIEQSISAKGQTFTWICYPQDSPQYTIPLPILPFRRIPLLPYCWGTKNLQAVHHALSPHRMGWNDARVPCHAAPNARQTGVAPSTCVSATGFGFGGSIRNGVLKVSSALEWLKMWCVEEGKCTGGMVVGGFTMPTQSHMLPPSSLACIAVRMREEIQVWRTHGQPRRCSIPSVVLQVSHYVRSPRRLSRHHET